MPCILLLRITVCIKYQDIQQVFISMTYHIIDVDKNWFLSHVNKLFFAVFYKIWTFYLKSCRRSQKDATHTKILVVTAQHGPQIPLMFLLTPCCIKHVTWGSNMKVSPQQWQIITGNKAQERWYSCSLVIFSVQLFFFIPDYFFCYCPKTDVLLCFNIGKRWWPFSQTLNLRCPPSPLHSVPEENGSVLTVHTLTKHPLSLSSCLLQVWSLKTTR